MKFYFLSVNNEWPVCFDNPERLIRSIIGLDMTQIHTYTVDVIDSETLSGVVDRIEKEDNE